MYLNLVLDNFHIQIYFITHAIVRYTPPLYISPLNWKTRTNGWFFSNYTRSYILDVNDNNLRPSHTVWTTTRTSLASLRVEPTNNIIYIYIIQNRYDVRWVFYDSKRTYTIYKIYLRVFVRVRLYLYGMLCVCQSHLSTCTFGFGTGNDDCGTVRLTTTTTPASRPSVLK